MKVPDLFPVDQTQVAAMDELLDLLDVDAAADRADGAWFHAGQSRVWVAHDTAVWIDPAVIWMPLSQSVAERASAPTLAAASRRVSPSARRCRNSSRRGLTLRASLVKIPAFRAQA
jgi:hypothetical protein